jgi:uncharacterized protein
MGRHELQYPQDAINTVKRHDERGISCPAPISQHVPSAEEASNKPKPASYSLRTIHELINGSPILHISFNTEGSPFPTTLPMLGQMGSFARPSSSTGDPLDLYVHGYVSSRLMNMGRKHTKQQEGEEPDEGLPVCVAASHVDGLVLALSSFSHSYNYRSAVLFGYAALVTDSAEKNYALEQITNGIVPDRWNHTRLPLNNAELQSTSVLRIRIVSGSAKIRTGNANDERVDMENDELRDGNWTGVLPVYSSIGTPVGSDYNKVEVPAHVADFIEDFNRENREYCLEAIKKK